VQILKFFLQELSGPLKNRRMPPFLWHLHQSKCSEGILFNTTLQGNRTQAMTTIKPDENINTRRSK